MRQKLPFVPTTPPTWLEELTRLTYCFSVMSPAQRNRATQAGSQMSELNFITPLSTNYPSKLLKNRDPNLPPDHVRREILDYQRRGVRILGVVPPNLQYEVYEGHPDWRRIATNTTVIPHADGPVGGPLCLLGPWGDFFIDLLAEILTLYPAVDAFSFDGLHHSGSCYCQHCRRNYSTETGLELPSVNLDDLAYRRYLSWADLRLEALVLRMQKRLKALKPTVALVTWTTNAGRFGHLLDIPRNMSARMNLLFDAPDQEFWMDESNRGNTLVPAFANAVIWARSNHRIAFSSPYLFSHGNPYGPDSFPPHEVLRRMFLTLTYGARPSMALAQPEPLLAPTYASLKEIKRRTPWMTHVSPEPWAALVLSDNTRVNYARVSGQMEERYLAHVLGFFRTAVEEHLPVTLINDEHLTSGDLARYQVLILPNTACLSDEQVRAITQFVEKGGGLVATLDTSLCDALGEPRTDFALAPLFGAHYQGIPKIDMNKTVALDVNFAKGLPPSYWEKRKNIYALSPAASLLRTTPNLLAYLGDTPVTLKGPAVAVGNLSRSTTVEAHLALRESQGTALPAILSQRYGKGSVIYFAAGVDAAYYLYPYPYQRLLLTEAIRRVATTPFGISIKAPMCVHTTFFRQRKPSGERLIVHLFNDLNTTGGHARPEDDVPLREEVVPIAGIQVHFSGYHIARVHLEPEGIPLPLRERDRGQEVVVPQLIQHAMVVAELRR